MARARRSAADSSSERWVYLSFVVPLLLVISVNMALQWSVAWSWGSGEAQIYPFTAANLFGMWSFSLLPALVGAAAMLPFYPANQPMAVRLSMAAAFSVMAGALRFGLEYATWGPSVLLLVRPVIFEGVISVVLPFSCVAVSMYLAESQVKSIDASKRATELEFVARQAALERENAELRVRRELSSVLHDHVQQRLVYAASRLQTEVVPLAAANEDQAAIELLEEIIADIDRLREREVRQLSHSLFPLGADLGLHQAVALVLARVPGSVKVNLTTTESAAAFDTLLSPQWDIAHRAVLAEILDEAMTNALKHGRARSIWVELDVRGDGVEEAVVLTVLNDGEPLRPDPALSGLAKHRIRTQLRGGGLNLGADADGRTRLVAWLPTAIPLVDPPEPALEAAAVSDGRPPAAKAGSNAADVRPATGASVEADSPGASKPSPEVAEA
ncbi:MAG: hypothetical protein LBO20_03250 [Bifidobacteriaceae bacterium]|jgi:signal transduction histidine kinase|nr:hypothetical protein [Bifidobacteriaceae bacterium]